MLPVTKVQFNASNQMVPDDITTNLELNSIVPQINLMRQENKHRVETRSVTSNDRKQSKLKLNSKTSELETSKDPDKPPKRKKQ